MAPKLFPAATLAVILSALLAANLLEFPYPSSYDNFDELNHTELGRFEFIPIDGAIGPESFAFDRLGQGPYTGVSDGRIIKWQEDQRRWIDFAVTSPNRYFSLFIYLFFV